MKIVITARDYAACSDAQVQRLRAAGHTVRDYSSLGLSAGAPLADMIRLVADADAVIAGLEPIGAALLDACPSLRLVSRRGIGYDSVDIAACRARGVTVARTLGAVEGAVAELVMAYILHFARRLDLQSAAMHAGLWQRMRMPGAKNSRLGLVGFGGIGKEIARRATAFGMQVAYYCRHPDPAWDAAYGVQYLPLDRLLAQSDYVSVNVPLTDATKGMCDASFFARMQPGSVFINIARGPVMDAGALRAALDSGRLRGAGVDVYDREPCTDSPLVGCPSAILTPHTATYTAETFEEMNRIAAQNLLDWSRGRLPAANRVV